MPVYKLNPLTDERWTEFLERRDDASIFHSPGWLEALRRTYGYEPVVYTTAGPGKELSDGIVCCQVNSWLTGRRLVSLPFSDHCQPLTDDSGNLADLLAELSSEVERDNLKYIEIRPLREAPELTKHTGFACSAHYYYHEMDISDDLDTIYAKLHKNAVKLMIRNADREGLTYEQGRSESQLRTFHNLLLVMRRKHHIPPQPLAWFRNLLDCLGPSIDIRIMRKDGVAVSSVIMILYKGVCYYKYMGYNPETIKMGGTPALVWRAIAELKERGAVKLDYGRTDADNESLAVYKSRWSATQFPVVYYQYPAPTQKEGRQGFKLRLAKSVFAHLPDSMLEIAGKVFYKHIG